MSKERLEKARKILNHIKGYGVYDGNDDIEIFEWLIEQAERVEELEELNRILSSDKSMFIEELVREQQQNQRYKQALGRVLDFYPGVPNAEYIPTEMLFEIKNIARKALEREG